MYWDVLIVFLLTILWCWLLFVTVYFFYFIWSLFSWSARYIDSYNKSLLLIKKEIGFLQWKKLIDLGSGNGKALRFFAKHYEISSLVWHEYNIVAIYISKLLTFFSPHKSRISFVWEDLFSAKVSDADYIYLYLIPGQMERLEEALIPKLKKNTTIIANSFKFPNLKPYRVLKDGKLRIFLYKA